MGKSQCAQGFPRFVDLLPAGRHCVADGHAVQAKATKDIRIGWRLPLMALRGSHHPWPTNRE
jgi:hypothetical protein